MRSSEQQSGVCVSPRLNVAGADVSPREKMPHQRPRKLPVVVFASPSPGGEGRGEGEPYLNSYFQNRRLISSTRHSEPPPSKIGFLLRLTLILLVNSNLIRAETKAPDNHSKPIPIAKIKRSTAVDFERDVLPILKKNCLACHNKTTAKARLILETPEDILKGGDSGPAATPRQSRSSLLLKAASHRLEDTIMPPPANKVQASDLNPEELGLVSLWIDQGAKASLTVVRPIEWQPLPDALNPIYAVALTPDGQFAACARANQIFLYHLPSRQLVGRLTDPQLINSGLYARPGVAHRSIIHALAFSPDGNLLASGAHREVKIWRRPQDLRKYSLASVARKAVTALAVSSDGKSLATGDDDGRIQIWNLATGRLARRLPGCHGAVHSLKFSADNSRLVVAEMDGACLADYDIAADGGLNLRGRLGSMKSPDGICLDREGATWVASFEEDAFIRVSRDGDELHRIDVPGRRAIACVLGGEERRTLFCLSAATSHEELRQRKSSARIDVVEVEVAGAGNP